jgi:hypothetical protein
MNYGTPILVAGLCILALVYDIYFFKKPVKTHLDVLKAIWVTAFITDRVMNILHLRYDTIMTVIAMGLFWIMFLDFIYMNLFRKRAALPEEELPE